jgi:hypothetical protein
MTTEDWLAWAVADAERRGLPELMPLIESLAAAQRTLRAADWNEDAQRGPGPSGEASAPPDDAEARP